MSGCIKTLKEKLRKRPDADEIREHGVEAGFPGLTLYKETNALFDKHQQEVWQQIADHAEETERTVGEVLEAILGDDGWTIEMFKNRLIWWYTDFILNE